jgi:hypothetical protein
MKLSNETLTVLKNFSTINQGIQFKQGKKLTTVSPSKTVLAQANLTDEFPQEFCIYDLNQFLSVYNLNKDCELDFTSSDVIFKSTNGKNKSNYRMTAPDMIVTPPNKELTLPSVDCSFTLSEDDYKSIMSASSVLSSPHIAVKSNGDVVEIVTFDAADNSAHTNSTQVGAGNGKKYSIVFKTENIKMIPGSYDVQISFKGIGHFKNTKNDIQYWIAFEAKESKVSE